MGTPQKSNLKVELRHDVDSDRILLKIKNVSYPSAVQ